jgi:Tol biopolymer transport system component
MSAPRVRHAQFAVALALCACSAMQSPVASRHAPGPPVQWTPPALSGPLYESSPTFSSDGAEVVFMRAGRRFTGYRLLWSRCEAGGWAPPQPPSFAAADGIDEADPAFSPDGSHLYYVSARGNDDGNLDIWMVERDGDGRWGEPARLPEPVNSPASELLPRPQPDGRLLFGSSRGGGYGQGDIYLAAPQPDGSWQVANVGPPISTGANEYEAELARDGRTMVVVADRGDRSHLYLYDLSDGGWVERGRVPARDDAFQVGPLLSPRGDRLLFAQAADDVQSGEWFLSDLAPQPDASWPPGCR